MSGYRTGAGAGTGVIHQTTLVASHEPAPPYDLPPMMPISLHVNATRYLDALVGLSLVLTTTPEMPCDVGRAARHGGSTTGNYLVHTTSEIEWAFVVDDDATPEQFGLTTWPVESLETLPERMRDEDGRCRQPLAIFEAAVIALNEQLAAARQPRIISEEIIAARLYTLV
eukprot:CAMPEP_0194235782 /NCGR_PEP_ID=MMETSP0158-20130606/3181_1 /TAXON_ID=33649 /ORGANISM="Thalassionema nitzschioides, Strain L26-B" /LENGTH=169 /DNA_ID=CAMNT_0038969331 /DNA_START=102 /DNA_END=612 /DNA_ORIENTATION=-